jgi:hypothetical protein
MMMLESARPEIQLVAACARALGPADHVRRVVRGDLDWILLLSVARRGGVLAAVHAGLAGAPAVPAAVEAYLRRHAGHNAERNERLLADLRLLLDALASRGVEGLPLRCAWLASPLLEIVDLDVLVRAHEVPAAERVLHDLGFRPEVAASTTELAVLRYSGFARRFVNAAGTVVSLQWAVLPRALQHGAPLAQLRADRRALDLAGRPAATLAPASLLQILCLRGSAHRWHRLGWIREVALLLAEIRPDDLERARQQARASGGLRALRLGALLASDLLGAHAGGLAEEARGDTIAVSLARETVAELSHPTRGLPGARAIARYHWRGRERPGDRIAYAFRRAITPSVEDAWAMPVPRRLVPLLFVVRPARLLADARETRRRRLDRIPGRIVRFSTTPPYIVDRMLTLAGVTAADTLCDVGCGDGGIVARAAARIGCQTIGVEIDPRLIEAARRRARAAGVESRVELHCADVRSVDLSRATVVTLYLNAAASLAMRPLLQAQLRPGARIVSRNFDMGDWLPDAADVIEESAWGSETLYLWRVDIPRPAGAGDPAPAAVAGR